jgi:hypothetical protein
LDQQDPKSDAQELDLGDSIDALLGSIDESCAQFEKQPEPDPSEGMISDDGTIIEPNPEPESESDAETESSSDETPEAIDEESAQGDEPGETGESVGDEALDALDAVSEIAEELLEESIGDLLDEMPTPEAIDDEPGESSQEPEAEAEAEAENADDTLVTEELLESINEDLVGEIQADAALTEETLETEPEPETPSDPIPEPSDGGETIEEAEATEATEPTEPAEAAEGVDADDLLESLDDALADVGDELLMGDFEDADGEMIDSESLGESIDPSMLLDQLDLAQADSSGDDDSTADDTPPVPAPAPTPAQAKAKPQEAVPTTPTDSPSPSVRVPDAIKASPSNDADDDTEMVESEIESIWQRLAHAGKSYAGNLIPLVLEESKPMAAKGILALSKPIASKPVAVRNSIGYIAIWTLFLATVLWLYMMFFRTVPTPVPAHAPSRVVMPGEDLEPIENQMATQGQEP